MDEQGNVTTYGRICNQFCDCDYRVEIFNCREEYHYYRYSLAIVIGTCIGLAAVIFDLSWILAFNAYICYVFGVAQTLITSNRVLYDAWFSSPHSVDLACIIANIGPWVFMNLGSIGQGIYASQGNIDMANTFLRIGYYIGVTYVVVLSITVAYFGTKLIRLLKHSTFVRANVHLSTTKVRAGILKVRVTVFIGSICMAAIGIVAATFASIRLPIVTNYGANLFFSGFIVCIGPVASFIIMLAVLFYPHVAYLTIDEVSPHEPPLSLSLSLNLSRDEEPEKEIARPAKSPITFPKPMSPQMPDASPSPPDPAQLRPQSPSYIPDMLLHSQFSQWHTADSSQTFLNTDDSPLLHQTESSIHSSS
ncbi:hypothetical protein BC940DRAFT_318629 [Gongronella butleri]|nr:hypothetical protein BC940DRAFT_318629 [Gongronella butleri]